jgi:hypothetical protein
VALAALEAVALQAARPVATQADAAASRATSKADVAVSPENAAVAAAMMDVTICCRISA